MKTAAIVFGALGIPVLAFAQGSLNFNNYFASRDPANKLPIVNAPVYVRCGFDLKCDDNYYIAIFGGPAGAPTASLVSATWAGTNVVKSFNTGAGAGYIKNGQNVQWLGMDPGALATVQVRAWSASLGATYEAALAALFGGTAAGGIGASETMEVTLGTPSLPAQPRLGADTDPAYAINGSNPGLASFCVISPEPSVVALGGLGLAGAFLMRRRK